MIGMSRATVVFGVACVLVSTVTCATERVEARLPAASPPKLRVLSLNAGRFSLMGSDNRIYRFRTLGKLIKASGADVVMLQEVWFKADRKPLRASMPYSVFFDKYTNCASSMLLPLKCSGLAILSRFPIIGFDSVPFDDKPSIWDVEFHVNKAIAHVRFEWYGLIVDVFNTHLVSYESKAEENSDVRGLQSAQAQNVIAKSNADLKILGIDMNAMPDESPGMPYTIFTMVLTDALTAKYPHASHDPAFATCGTGAEARRLDYVMFHSKAGVNVTVANFVVAKAGSNLSDHKAIIVDLEVHNDKPDASARRRGGHLG